MYLWVEYRIPRDPSQDTSYSETAREQYPRGPYSEMLQHTINPASRPLASPLRLEKSQKLSSDSSIATDVEIDKGADA